MLYACQDYDFDSAGRTSIRFPNSLASRGSLLIARLLHVGAFAALVALYWITHLGIFALIGVVATAALLLSAPASQVRTI